MDELATKVIIRDMKDEISHYMPYDEFFYQMQNFSFVIFHDDHIQVTIRRRLSAEIVSFYLKFNYFIKGAREVLIDFFKEEFFSRTRVVIEHLNDYKYPELVFINYEELTGKSITPDKDGDFFIYFENYHYGVQMKDIDTFNIKLLEASIKLAALGKYHEIKEIRDRW